MRWNHNIHYQRLILDRIPPAGQRALDVGCGEGILTRALRKQIPEVVGIDQDRDSIERATQAGGDITYRQADVATYDAGPFDLVASIAARHHMDTEQALGTCADLLNRNGRLVVIGYARRELPHDLAWEVAGAIKTGAMRRTHGYREHHSPVQDPALTHRQTREIALDTLPGARYRQLALWRYLLDWTAP